MRRKKPDEVEVERARAPGAAGTHSSSWRRVTARRQSVRSDRVGLQPGRVREEDDAQRRLREADGEIRGDAAQEAPLGDPRGAPGSRPDEEREERRQR